MNDLLEAILSICFLGAMMWGVMKFMLRDIHKDLQGLQSQISEIKTGMNEIKNELANSRMRTDNLYNICIDMLKERK